MTTPTVAESRRRFKEFLGLGVKFTQGEPHEGLALLPELGVNWVREEVYWSEMEPSPGNYQRFSERVTERMRFYREKDIGVVFLLVYENDKAYPNTDDKPLNYVNPEAFGRYAAHIAKLLKATGVRFVLEIWNEPHNSGFAKKAGGNWQGKAPSAWVNHYVKMVHEAVRQVKAIDPGIKLLTDDDMWIVHYWFLEAGLPSNIDGFAVHPYTPGPPERAAVNADTDWTRPFVVVDADSSFRSAVEKLRTQGQLKLGRAPQIWVTEWGWPVVTPGVNGAVSEDTLAAYLPRAFISAFAAGVEVMCWFSSFDSVDGPMGLRDNKHNRRKSFLAYKTMSQELGRYYLSRQVAGASSTTKGLQAYLFAGAEGQKLVLWSADGQTRNVVLPAQRVVDALGREQSAIQVGAMPVYVTGSWTPEALQAALPKAP